MKLILATSILLIVSAIGIKLFTEPNYGIVGPPDTNASVQVDDPLTTTIAQDLSVPWALAYLPDGSLLTTQREGTLTLIRANGMHQEVAKIDDVKQIGEGGLLGLTIHPNYEANNFIYVYYTYSASGLDTLNRVVRFTYRNNQLTERQVIIDQIPGASNHNGGRIKFSPDGYLYVGTGDASQPSLAQDTQSLAGKILRVTENGLEVSGNPFNNLVYSYGHRNVQGLAWDNQGNLWATEHGPNANDELNQIQAGKNYGWPVIQGNQQRDGMESPLITSGGTTWAPAGLTFAEGTLYFVGLRGMALYEADLNNNQVQPHFQNIFGRLREAITSPEGNLVISSSNRDGRGQPKSNDDVVLQINVNHKDF